MGIQLRYGNYYHPEGEPTVVISKRVETTADGVPTETRFVWQIAGRVEGDNTAAVVAGINALETAYGRWGRDAVLFDNSTNLACHFLPNAGSLRGVKVVGPPSYPVGTGAQLSTFRDYNITLEAEYPAVGFNGSRFVAWQETVTFTGGQLWQDLVETVNGPAVPYITALRTPYEAVQQGSATGLNGYPPVPPPLWPQALAGRNPQTVTYTGPSLNAPGRRQNWSVSWSYRFKARTPLVGLPTLQPGN
jgi:hypothetical protein